MILQRMSQAIKRQDWFQVIIEILIVVIGIFLGLQVQAWYDGKEARIDQDRFIDYLITDLENSIFYFDNQIIFYQDQLNNARRTLELLDNESLSPNDKETFELGLIYHGFASGLDNYLHTLLNDDLTQVVDPVLRRSINNFIGSLRADESIVQGNRMANFANIGQLREKAIIESIARENRYNDYNFDNLKSDDKFRVGFKSVLIRVRSIKRRTEQFRIDTVKLQDALKKYQMGVDIGELTFRNEERVGS